VKSMNQLGFDFRSSVVYQYIARAS
jgi:hypothetical protein